MTVPSEIVYCIIIGLISILYVGSALESYFCECIERPRLKTKICRNRTLWTVNQTGESQCFLKCLRDGERCQAIFHNGLANTCQGHSAVLTELDDCYDEEGSNYYQKCTSRRKRNCQEILCSGQHATGIYTIYPDDDSNGVSVRCDMDTDGGGWTVFQRRVDGSVNFDRLWNDYKSGFGNKSTEYWLGLDNIHKLTSQGNVTLRVDLIAPGPPKRSAYAVYSKFTVGDESSKYILTVAGYSGNANDDLSKHNGMKFTTTDNDNDLISDNCAIVYHGAFWFANCHPVNLNGLYVSVSFYSGVVWDYLSGPWVSLIYTEMKLR
ncbi:hypothetical protein ACJMK2_006022 [Sinanodonta woodiana]|uniref:Fibrinogen C-terminal domain-containing protein n=1 Tax=Sinanodonta woodiana TaxID=1069815 RepID=A0ABD3VSA5_SINWO